MNNIDYLVNIIVATLFTMMSISTTLLSDMISILFNHMVRTFYDIVTILAIVTMLRNTIVRDDHMMINIVHHIVEMGNIVDSIVTMYGLYCEQFRRSLLMFRKTSVMFSVM